MNESLTFKHLGSVLVTIMPIVSAVAIFLPAHAIAAGEKKGVTMPFTHEQERRRFPAVSYENGSTKASMRQNDPNAEAPLPAAALRYTTRGELKFAVADENGKVNLLDGQALSNLVFQLSTAVGRIPCGDQILPERMTLALGEVEVRYYVKQNCESGFGQYYVPGSALQKKLRPSTGPLPASVPGAQQAPGAAPAQGSAAPRQ